MRADNESVGAPSNPETWIARRDAAQILHVTSFGVSWLIFCDELEESFRTGGHQVESGVTQESLNVYRHWLASSTGYERLVHRSIKVLLAPFKFVMETVGGIFSVPWN